VLVVLRKSSRLGDVAVSLMLYVIFIRNLVFNIIDSSSYLEALELARLIDLKSKLKSTLY
jgi:hypothetical protein